MHLSNAEIRQLHTVVKEFSNDRTTILAIPGQIKNNGRLINAIDIVIGQNSTRKAHRRMYRGLTSNFRDWLKKEIDKIENL
jgi:hypothetical protein